MEVNRFDKVKLEIIKNKAGDPDFDPTDTKKQHAQWLKIGVKRIREGEEVKAKDLDGIEKMGGTDHPDPWVGPMEYSNNQWKKKKK